MKKKWFHNKTRMIFQLAILGLIIGTLIFAAFRANLNPDYEKYCPFGGIMSLGSKLNLGTMSCAISETQVFIGIGVLLLIIVVGKLFCGWLCPVGTVSEWFNKIGTRLGVSMTLKGLADRILRLGKYVLLFFAAYFTMTSSELWCKKFCPYFGPVSGFNVDVVAWASLLAIFGAVIASIFFKKFWCKYACPLGALSNVFANILITGPILIVYIILVLAGVKIGLIWLLLALVTATALTEAIRYRFFSVSPFRIRPDKNLCTSCKVCDSHCPEGIEVSSYDDAVTHPDCTLCLDCVKACPVHDSLKFKGGKWLPPTAIVVMIILALLFAKQFPMTTLSERWGHFDEADSLNRIATVVFDDLKTIHCYGSAKTLQNKAARNPGILGIDVWAANKKVVLYYDTAQISETDVKRYIFTPSRYNLRKGPAPENTPQYLVGYRVGIWELWDGVDNMHIYRMLEKEPGVYGFSTEFGEPVYAKFYIDPDLIGPADLKKIIEQKKYEYVLNGDRVVERVHFSLENEGEYVDTLTYVQYRRTFFPNFNRAFNEYNDYSAEDMMVMEYDFPDAENSTLIRRMSHLTSHLSFDPGIVRLRAFYSDRPVLQIYFIPEKTDAEKIDAHLRKEKLTCKMQDGSTRDYDNVFEFEGPYQVKSLK